jgi:hypothetical protein
MRVMYFLKCKKLKLFIQQAENKKGVPHLQDAFRIGYYSCRFSGLRLQRAFRG